MQTIMNIIGNFLMGGNKIVENGFILLKQEGHCFFSCSYVVF